MKFSRDLLTLRLFAYGSFVALWGGLLLIKAITLSDGNAMLYMVAWATLVAVAVGLALLLWPSKKLPDPSPTAPNPPKP
ncbi:MAG: hypothetical protein ACKVP0_05430 [Pirellulaceae bacterium]